MYREIVENCLKDGRLRTVRMIAKETSLKDVEVLRVLNCHVREFILIVCPMDSQLDSSCYYRLAYHGHGNMQPSQSC